MIILLFDRNYICAKGALYLAILCMHSKVNRCLYGASNFHNSILIDGVVEAVEGTVGW
jgi:hypothetical protein